MPTSPRIKMPIHLPASTAIERKSFGPDIKLDLTHSQLNGDENAVITVTGKRHAECARSFVASSGCGPVERINHGEDASAIILSSIPM